MHQLSFPAFQFHIRWPSMRLRVPRIWIVAPIAVVAVAVTGAIVLVHKPIPARASQPVPFVATEYVSSDPTLPSAAGVKFPEDYAEPAPSF